VNKVPWLRRSGSAVALRKCKGIRAAREEEGQVSPVVKRRVTSLHSNTHDGEQECESCRGAALRERRDPQGSGGVVPKHRVAAAIGLESMLFSLFPGENYN
jgi:hypothetical protein